MRTLSVSLLAAAAVAISVVFSRSRPRLGLGGTSPDGRAGQVRRSLDQIRAAGL
jgi:hypothetical protein